MDESFTAVSTSQEIKLTLLVVLVLYLDTTECNPIFVCDMDEWSDVNMIVANSSVSKGICGSSGSSHKAIRASISIVSWNSVNHSKHMESFISWCTARISISCSEINMIWYIYFDWNGLNSFKSPNFLHA